MRKPSKLPDGEYWIGKRVIYQSRPGSPAEMGTVKRMASGKALAMFVIYDGDPDAKYTYATDLTIVEEVK